MIKRLGLLFADGSILVLPEGTEVEVAWREAQQHDEGEAVLRTRVARLEVEVTEILKREKTHR